MMIHKLVGAFALLVCSALAWAEMPVIELSAGFHRIEAEVAADQKNRMVQRGMLFVFTEKNTHCMWMRNTFIPLSVAFIDEEGRIINIEDMQPQTESNHCAKVPARYALEMNIGWFAQRGIKPGTKLNGIDKAPRPQ